jgi:hypothetical protein
MLALDMGDAFQRTISTLQSSDGIPPHRAALYDSQLS